MGSFSYGVAPFGGGYTQGILSKRLTIPFLAMTTWHDWDARRVLASQFPTDFYRRRALMKQHASLAKSASTYRIGTRRFFFIGGKMVNRFIVSALLFFFALGAGAADVPGYAQERDKFMAPARRGAPEARVRITIASEVAQVEPSVRVGDLLLCASTRCYRARTSGYVTMTNTAKGKAEVVADVSIPIARITDVYFADVSGTSTIKGHLTLDMPLAIGTACPAVELMVAVRKQMVGTHTTYVPVQSASMYFTDESELVHYLPSMQTVAELSLGTKLTLPAGASNRPQIFNIGIVKVGERFPKIDILPYINLKKAASVEVRAVRKASITHEPVVPVTPAEPDSDARIVGAPTAQPSVRLAFCRTAVIEPSVLEKLLPGSASSESGSSSAAATPKSCSEYLAQPIVPGLSI